MIDLHTHSSASDGDLKPARLVEKAGLLGLKALALTDHDTISGLAEAENAAKDKGIRFIPGVELEIQTEFPTEITVVGGEFHLLGLGISRLCDEFLAALTYLEDARERRNRKMVEKIREAGIDADYEDIKAFAGALADDTTAHGGLSDGVTSGTAGGARQGKLIVGRPHFGAFLISRKVAKDQEQAFKRWLGKDRPFYVPKEGLNFSDASRLIHRCGGAAVLAHPMSLYVSWGRLPRLLAYLKDNGLDGIEAWHPTARVGDCKRLEELGRSLGLFITAGSDFHGSARPERKLGYTAGNREIEDGFLAGLHCVPVSGSGV